VELTVPKSASGLKALIMSNVICSSLEKWNHNTPRSQQLCVPVRARRPPCPCYLGFPWKEIGTTNLEGGGETSPAAEQVHGPPLHLPESQRGKPLQAY